jgi:oligopeptide/dipeptide ABC transporter ATP-binding protein
VEGLTKHYPVTSGVFGRVSGQVQAVDDVSFHVAAGETLGLVGESGCGKTTVGRCVIRLIEPTRGRVTFDGVDVTGATSSELTRLRRHLQIVFQDPVSSLNPRKRVVDIVGEALEVHRVATGAAVDARVAELLSRVGLPPSWMNRYPHEFSGGQRQRIGIARAIALSPKLIVCDEAVSALDVSIQAQVVNLLVGLQREMGLSYLFIAHDLSVVRHMSHRIAVMYLGQMVELGPAKRLFRAPGHPYTQALLSAIPVPTPGRRNLRVMLEGDVPTPLNPPSGCRFHTRCPAAFERCSHEEPKTFLVEDAHSVKCWHAEGLEGDADWHRILMERVNAATQRHAVDEPSIPPAPVSRIVRSRRPASSAKAATGRFSASSVAGSGLTLLGTTLTFYGRFVLGPLLVGLAYAAFTWRGTVAWRRADTGIAALVIAALAALGVHRSRSMAEDAAIHAIAVLGAEVTAQSKITGAMPTTLADLGFRLYPLFRSGDAVDPWGRPYRYAVPGADGRPFDIGSTGPDGVPSADDIGHVPAPSARKVP